jgi:hypothetical protein
MNLSKAKNIALKSIIAILTLVILFHVLIMIKLIPYNITWGGRLENDAQMYVFETISILINIFLITVLLLKTKYINHQFSEKILNGILRFFQMLFILNTAGNIIAKTNFEKSFAFLTLLLAVLIGIILKENDKKQSNT